MDSSVRSGVIGTAARFSDVATLNHYGASCATQEIRKYNYLLGGALIGVRDARLVYKVLELTLADEWDVDLACGTCEDQVPPVGTRNWHATLW